jgi:hypothetical protein
LLTLNFMLVLLPFCRSQPVNSYVWGSDTVISVRFNPGEPNLLASSARYTPMLMSMLNIHWLVFCFSFSCVNLFIFCSFSVTGA